MVKVIFMGGNLVAVQCLKLLLSHAGIKVVGVLPRSSDDGMAKDIGKWNYSLKHFTQKTRLPLIEKLDAEDIRYLNPDYIVLVQYDRILKRDIINIPKIGCINLHFSPLPIGRGCFSIPWAILEDEMSGVTLHWIDSGIDAGPIIDQKIYQVRNHHTAFVLYHRAVKSGIQIFKDNLDNLVQGMLNKRIQEKGKSTYHPQGYPYDRWIDWTWDASKIDRFVRALTFDTYPSARTNYKGRELEIKYPVEIRKTEDNLEPGLLQVVGNDFFDVSTGNNGILRAKNCSFDGDYTLHIKAGERLTE